MSTVVDMNMVADMDTVVGTYMDMVVDRDMVVHCICIVDLDFSKL